MRRTALRLVLTCAALALARRAEAQPDRMHAIVNQAMADKIPCTKAECLPWTKTVTTPTGAFIVTRCATSPSQQIELALAARMMAREANNLAWNELAVVAAASAFIHDPGAYTVVQASPSGMIAELDARLGRGEYGGGTLQPGGAQDFLDVAAKWSSQPQCR